MHQSELISRLSQSEMSRRTFGLVISTSVAPSSLLGSALDSPKGEELTYFLGGIVSHDPNRQIRHFMGEVNYLRLEEMPFVFNYTSKPIGEFFPTAERGRVGDGVIRTDGSEFVVARITGTDDENFSSPFYNVTCTSDGYQERSRFGIMQGPHSKTAVTRLGFLPEGEYHVEIDNTEFSGNDGQGQPAVDFFSLSFTNPLMQRLVIPLIGSYGQKLYPDSDPGIGFREDAPVMSRIDIYERGLKRFPKIANYNIKERMGHLNSILHQRIAPYDIDLAQIAEGMADGACSRVGFQSDWSVSLGSLMFDIRKHNVVVTDTFPKHRFLDENGFWPPVLQETGKHGLFTDRLETDIFYKPMPTFPGANWPDFGFILALSVAAWRQTIASGQVEKDDPRVVEFADKHLGGKLHLLTSPAFIYR